MHAGGSGCGCSASVLNGYLLSGMRQGKWKKIVFAPTGALLSPHLQLSGRVHSLHLPRSLHLHHKVTRGPDSGPLSTYPTGSSPVSLCRFTVDLGMKSDYTTIVLSKSDFIP